MTRRRVRSSWTLRQHTVTPPNSEEHLAVAALIQRIIDGKNSVRKF
jgi:hypothetical protein